MLDIKSGCRSKAMDFGAGFSWAEGDVVDQAGRLFPP
jgi:hypothetical protein